MGSLRNHGGDGNENGEKATVQAMFTLVNKIAFAQLQKPYRIGLLFIHIKERRFRRDYCNGAATAAPL